MRFTFSPQRRDAPLDVRVAGDVLTIDGAAFDFSTVPDGGEVPFGEVPCDFIIGAVTRAGGVLVVPLIAPYGASLAGRFVEAPMPINAGDGLVAMPFAGSWAAEPEIAP